MEFTLFNISIHVFFSLYSLVIFNRVIHIHVKTSGFEGKSMFSKTLEWIDSFTALPHFIYLEWFIGIGSLGLKQGS